MRKSGAVCAALVLVLAGCGKTKPAASTSPSSSATTQAKSVPKTSPTSASTTTARSSTTASSCTLTTSYDYIERTTFQSGEPASAFEIGNVNLGNCTPSLDDFAQTADQAAGDCTTIALAADNPSYDVNASPAPALRKVIEQAGPGC